MGFGLYGKLPQKRDFISLGIPGDVLMPLENWLQSAIAASRSQLGKSWEETYLVAPIWRFWIGPKIFGTGCAGALMPSVDGVGRFFPLMAVYICAGEERLAPPSYAPQDKWYHTLEERLLSVLEEGAPAPDALLAGIDPPAFDQVAGRTAYKGGLLWQGEQDTDTPSFLAGLFDDDYREVSQARSYWWVPGNEMRGPVLHARNGLPDPYFHARMLKVVAD